MLPTHQTTIPVDNRVEKDDLLRDVVRSSIRNIPRDEFETVQSVVSSMFKTDANAAEMYAYQDTSRCEEKEKALDELNHLVALMKSGYHPKYFDRTTKKKMKEQFGPRWEQKFGYPKTN